MRALQTFSSLYIHRDPVDMRKSINGLSAIVQEEMGLSFSPGSLFIFCNRRRTHMKMLYFDHSGFALWLKKLEKAKFPWPKQLDQDVIEVSVKDLELLLEGIDVWNRFQEVSFETVV